MVTKFSFDTGEDESLKVYQKVVVSSKGRGTNSLRAFCINYRQLPDTIKRAGYLAADNKR